jgi:hypothetical protein
VFGHIKTGQYILAKLYRNNVASVASHTAGFGTLLYKIQIPFVLYKSNIKTVFTNELHY